MKYDKLLTLDKLAYDWVQGEEDSLAFQGLRFDERAYVLQMANLYSLNKLGILPLKRCQELKKKAVHEFAQTQTELYFAKRDYDMWAKRPYEVSKRLNELSLQIKNKDPQFVKTALEIIDLLTKQFVYVKLYNHICQSGFGDSEIEEIIRTCDKLPEKADKDAAVKTFYTWIDLIVNDKTLECFKSLTSDDLKKTEEFKMTERYTEIPAKAIPKAK